MTCTIVPIAESHVQGFHASLDAVARERRFLALVEAPPLDHILAFLQENVAADVAQFVALDGETVVGWCDILPGWAHAIRHRGTVGIGVLASHRGRGLGRQLLTTCLAKARAKGMTRVELEVRADNERAIRLYESVGFTPDTLYRRGMRFDDGYHDSLHMSLLFEDGA